MSRRPAQPLRRPRQGPAAPAAPATPAAATPAAATPATSTPTTASATTGRRGSTRVATAPRAAGRSGAGASVVAFAARARTRRRPSWRPSGRAAGVTLAVLAVVAALVWVVLASPLLAVREVAVTGTGRLEPDRVREAVGPATGTPLARVDTGDLAARVEALPLVGQAEVLRSWPRGLEVRVVERLPVAVVGGAGGGSGAVTLVDGQGRRLADVPEAPADLPELTAGTERAGARAVGAAVSVLEQMPADLRAQVATTQARSADSVTLTMRSGATVVWGGADSAQEKAEVLAVLLTQAADVYDVSAPRTPVLR